MKNRLKYYKLNVEGREATRSLRSSTTNKTYIAEIDTSNMSFRILESNKFIVIYSEIVHTKSRDKLLKQVKNKLIELGVEV